MNKVELAKKVAGIAGLSEKDAEKAIDASIDVITSTIKSDEEVMLTGFGVFSAKIRHARTGVNPRNPSEKIQIPEIRVPKFKAGKALKDALREKVETSAPAPIQEEIEPEESIPSEPESQPENEAGSSNE